MGDEKREDRTRGETRIMGKVEKKLENERGNEGEDDKFEGRNKE